MDNNKRLADNLRKVMGGEKISIYQGIVKSVEGLSCTVTFATLDVTGVRLRASLTDNNDHLLIVPKVGTAVTVGSLSGDLSQLVVLAVDQVESITINGGKLGGLINIEALTEKINDLVDKFNEHTHQVSTTGTATAQTGTAAATQSKAEKLDRKDYEDETIQH